MRKGKASSPGDGLMTTNKYAAYLGKTPVDPEGLKGRRRLTQKKYDQKRTGRSTKKQIATIRQTDCGYDLIAT